MRQEPGHVAGAPRAAGGGARRRARRLPAERRRERARRTAPVRQVLGCLVMCPTAHIEPGVVLAYGSRLTGELDVGRYPTGSDELCEPGE